MKWHFETGSKSKNGIGKESFSNFQHPNSQTDLRLKDIVSLNEFKALVNTLVSRLSVGKCFL